MRSLPDDPQHEEWEPRPVRCGACELEATLTSSTRSIEVEIQARHLSRLGRAVLAVTVPVSLLTGCAQDCISPAGPPLDSVADWIGTVLEAGPEVRNLRVSSHVTEDSGISVWPISFSFDSTDNDLTFPSIRAWMHSAFEARIDERGCLTFAPVTDERDITRAARFDIIAGPGIEGRTFRIVLEGRN